jgi:diketogulonate reductase-like aldo/keto reductase
MWREMASSGLARRVSLVSVQIILIFIYCTGQMGLPNFPALTAFENLRSAGKILAWGVSNFKVSDMENLLRVSEGDRCATNQVPYNLVDRGIEHDLLPWCEQHDMPLMAYSPLGGPDSGLLRDPILARIGAAHSCSASAVALAWTIRSGKVIAIPESGSVAHVRENAVALSLTLTPEELQTLDAARACRQSSVIETSRVWFALGEFRSSRPSNRRSFNPTATRS